MRELRAILLCAVAVVAVACSPDCKGPACANNLTIRVDAASRGQGVSRLNVCLIPSDGTAAQCRDLDLDNTGAALTTFDGYSIKGKLRVTELSAAGTAVRSVTAGVNSTLASGCPTKCPLRVLTITGLAAQFSTQPR